MKNYKRPHCLVWVVWLFLLILVLVSSSSSSSEYHYSTRTTTRRSACRLFLWDWNSAAKYALCRHLMTDKVYEGMGGKKFVRIRPGSLLDALYPLSNHVPNRCLCCGCTFPQHIAHWWFPRLYTPYDLHLDNIYQKAINSQTPSVDERKNQNKKQPFKTHTKQPSTADMNKEEYEPKDMKPFLDGVSAEQGNHILNFVPLNYHKLYVRLMGEKDHHKERKAIKKPSSRRKKQQQSNNEMSSSMENRTTMYGIKYQTPHRRPKNVNSRWDLLYMAVSKTIVIQQLENLLRIEAKENWKKELRLIRGY